MKCEYEGCKTGEEAVEQLRLTSFHGHWQNPMRLGHRVPARIAVCRKCAEYLCNDAELKWASEGRFDGTIQWEGNP